MTEYLKRVHSERLDQGKYYHWNTDCPDYPQRGKETVLMFKKEPTHIPACPKCIELDKKK